jgi:hypothetical protein
MLRDELIDIIANTRSRIIALLDKKVQEAGWVVPVVMPRALEKDEEITMPATLEELLNNKAHRTGGG